MKENENGKCEEKRGKNKNKMARRQKENKDKQGNVQKRIGGGKKKDELRARMRMRRLN